MKSVITALSVLALALLSVPASAQDNFAAGGISYQPGADLASQRIAGTGLYAHLTGSPNVAAFTVIDAVPVSVKPFSVTTNVGAGIATKIFQFKSIDIWTPNSLGVSWSGPNTGWQWTTGGLAKIPIRNYFIAPNIRILKSSVSNNSGYQIIAGVLFGWGW